MASSSNSTASPYSPHSPRAGRVYLVNTHHVKKVAGRKCHVPNCHQCLRQLMSYDRLLAETIGPGKENCALRAVSSQRERLLWYRWVGGAGIRSNVIGFRVCCAPRGRDERDEGVYGMPSR